MLFVMSLSPILHCFLHLEEHIGLFDVYTCEALLGCSALNGHHGMLYVISWSYDSDIC
jgi:hypothetical protein